MRFDGLLLALFSLSLGLFSSLVFAQQSTGTVGVGATILADCQIQAGNLNFGDYDPLTNQAVESTSSVYVTCTKGANYTIAFGGGNSGNTGQRTMTNGVDTLNYNIYSDATFSSILGEGGQAVSGLGTGNSAPYTIYGKIPGGQTAAPAGNYSDVVNINVNF